MYNVLVRTLIAAGAAMAIHVSGTAHAVPLPKPRPHIVVADTPRLCLARLIYAEAGNQPYIGKLLVGYSVKRRAEIGRRDFGGTTICGVAYAKTGLGTLQYSGMTESPAFIVGDRESWRIAQKAADLVLGGYRPLYEWAEATYFINPEFAGRRGKCWFERQLIELGWFEDHLFYREPRGDEEKLRLLLREPSEECRNEKRIALR